MKKTAAAIKLLKGKQKQTLLTCYDYQMACWLDRAGLDAVLVGDSLGEVLYGFKDTSQVTMELMLAHVKAVRKGLKNTHLIADLPFASYATASQATVNAKEFMALGADSVKMENPASEVVAAVLAEDIPVCGHVGLTPQSNRVYRKQGTTAEEKKNILQDAERLERLGCYALVLEALPTQLAQQITAQTRLVTIGIASGHHCDAQILVHYDLVGLTAKPKSFVRPLASLGVSLQAAAQEYIAQVKNS